MSVHDPQERDKTRLRHIMRERRARLDAAFISDYALRIARELSGHRIWQEAATIGGYAATGSEVSLGEVFTVARRQGKALFLPCVTGPGEMLFCPADGCELRPGAFGIPCPPLDFDRALVPDLVLVPGLAFDQKGNRLGMGGGFYDRYLGRNRPQAAIAVAYPFQVLESLVPSPWDYPLDGLLTETGLEIFHAQTRPNLP